MTPETRRELEEIAAHLERVALQPSLSPLDGVSVAVHVIRARLSAAAVEPCPGGSEYGHGFSRTVVHASGCCERHAAVMEAARCGDPDCLITRDHSHNTSSGAGTWPPSVDVPPVEAPEVTVPDEPTATTDSFPNVCVCSDGETCLEHHREVTVPVERHKWMNGYGDSVDACSDRAVTALEAAYRHRGEALSMATESAASWKHQYELALGQCQRLATEIERLRKVVEAARVWRLSNLRKTCPDCEEGCSHGAANDPLLRILAQEETR